MNIMTIVIKYTEIMGKIVLKYCKSIIFLELIFKVRLVTEH